MSRKNKKKNNIDTNKIKVVKEVNNGSKQNKNDDEMISALIRYSSTLNQIREMITPKQETSITKFRKKGLPYVAIIISFFSLIFSLKIYSLGEEYKRSLNPISFDINFLQKEKIALNTNSPYYPADFYDRYPLKYSKTSGDIMDQYLFKYDQKSDRVDVIKLKKVISDSIITKINEKEETTAKDLTAFLLVKNPSNIFDFRTYEQNKLLLDKADEMLCILDPAFATNATDYTGIYTIAFIGKNDQVYLSTFINKWSEAPDKYDTFINMEGVDVFDEYIWTSLISEHPKLESKKLIAQKTYEKSLKFLKEMR